MVRKRISPLRWTSATALLLGICAAIAVAVNLTAGVISVLVSIVGGAMFTLILASIFEWLVHRYVYHRKLPDPLGQIFRIHHRGHHAAIFPTWRYTTNGSVRRHPISEPDVSQLYPAGWKDLISKVAHFLFYMVLGFVAICLPAWSMTQNAVFLGATFLTLVVISDLFVRVHDAIHYPGQFKLVEAQPRYPFIDRHHFIHHVDIEANVNFLLPLADWCYGTLRTELTESEIAKHGTLEEAKANPIGHSEPARLFAERLKGGRRGSYHSEGVR